MISHTLSARLFMPRNESLSTSVLSEYQTFLSAKIMAEEVPVVRNFSDLGRLSDVCPSPGLDFFMEWVLTSYTVGARNESSS